MVIDFFQAVCEFVFRDVIGDILVVGQEDIQVTVGKCSIVLCRADDSMLVGLKARPCGVGNGL
ncbi:hypothetical protein D3C86_2110430 [compost metagenome]